MREFYVDRDISKAQTIHTDFYTSLEVFEHCKEKIFANSFQFIGSNDLVKNNEDAYPFTLLKNFLDEPLLLTKDKKGNLNLLSNVCTHRGNLVISEACTIPKLRCKYHGRTFSLDGKFQTMPEFKEVVDFPSAADDLAKLPLYTWRQWLFTSLSQKFAPEIFLNDMMKRVDWMPLEKFVFRPELSRDFHVKANWALYCENYLEGFHVPFVHAGLNEHLDFEESTTELFFPYSNLQLGISKSGESCFDLPPDSPDYGKKVAAFYFWVFPNMMFNFYPWGLSVNVVKPVSVSDTIVSFYSYVWDASKMDAGAGSGLDKVEMEDEEIVERVQQGVRSRFYNHGRYSVTKEKGTHHFHRILAEFMK